MNTEPPFLSIFEGSDHHTLRGAFSLDYMWINDGGACTGPSLMVWGDALSTGLLVIEKVIMGRPGEVCEIAVDVVNTSVGPTALCELRGLLVGGVPAEMGTIPDLEWRDQYAASMVALKIVGRTLGAGRSSLSVALVAPGEEEVEPYGIQVEVQSN